MKITFVKSHFLFRINGNGPPRKRGRPAAVHRIGAENGPKKGVVNGVKTVEATTDGLIERIFPELFAKRQDYLEQLDDSEESEDEDILGEIEHLKIRGQWFEKEVCIQSKNSILTPLRM